MSSRIKTPPTHTHIRLVEAAASVTHQRCCTKRRCEHTLSARVAECPASCMSRASAARDIA
eukprot:1959274-Pleurochrysis_carterae.AAC.1